MSGDLSAAQRARTGREGLPFWLELPLLVIVALVVAVLIKTFLVQAFWIPSGSMVPTLEIDDRVLVNKLEYRIQEPRRGDIVVFDSPYLEESDEPTSFRELAALTLAEALGIRSGGVPDDFIKRVIAVPGETVEVVDNQVLIDGLPISEPYLPAGVQMPDFGPVTVAPNELFVMGDNRNSSSDSRVFGPIDQSEVVGRAFVLMWPFDRWQGL
ncbi:MAG: signal peptidase I [Acidimicrobiia bacterium]|jgi:signal peptidase I|nr:MAG: signal peptidase I [Acidimicrobiia bacterium]